LLLDLKLEGKTVMVIGAGTEACRKVQSFLDSGAKIWVISREFSGCLEKLAEENRVALLKTEIKDAKAFVESLNPKPDVFLAVTDNSKLNHVLVCEAKKFGSMVYSVDNASLNDFYVPAIAKVGNVRVAVSTLGRSPAMAKELRQRIERLVTPEDLLEIELQAKMRSALKTRVSEADVRGKLLNEILNSVDIKEALKKGQISKAEELAMKIIESQEKKP
jgi:precorrin-2 dehydrogenase/sirohydrochlorin ferrochelatase